MGIYRLALIFPDIETSASCFFSFTMNKNTDIKTIYIDNNNFWKNARKRKHIYDYRKGTEANVENINIIKNMPVPRGQKQYVIIFLNPKSLTQC